MRAVQTMGAVVACLSVLTLTACQDAPSAVTSSSAPPASQVSTATTPSPSDTAVSPGPTRNDLATGSAQRRLRSGPVELLVNYHSAIPQKQWTPASTKPLAISASARLLHPSGKQIFLRTVTVRIDVAGDDGSLKPPGAQVDEATVGPGYLIQSPNVYGQVFALPAVSDGSTGLTLNITYEMLTQTAPRARTYSKQTVNDTIVVSLA